MDNRIKVGIRVRPLSSAEQQQNGDTSVVCDQLNRKIVVGLDSRSKSSFSFDWCYSSGSGSAGIYQEMCLPLINKVYEGYHATFFAYGQTGSGKTFTMGNSPESVDGIIQYAVHDIFEKRKAYQHEGKQVTIEVSYMEIYMEECYDLLSMAGEKKKVDLRENSRGETYVDGLTQRLVHSPAEFTACISHACKVRSVSKTAMNSHSSRSHAICTITIRVVTEEDTIIAKLNLVDLAGSERAKKTMATGDILQEGININKGLLALGNVVSALSTKSKQNETKSATGKSGITTTNSSSNHIHVPYRESKLTRLLKDSLGGNGMTALLACVSPAQGNCDETLNSLRFASRASSIVNVAKVNHEEKTDAHVLNQEVNRLRAQLTVLQEKYQELQQVKSAPPHVASATARVAHSDGSFTDMISGSSRLTSCFKSLVMHCFMEDVAIDDEILQKLKEDICTSSELFGCEVLEEEENKLSESILEDCDISGMLDLEGLEGFNCVPPIAKVLDRLTNLESHLKKRLNRAAHPTSNKSKATNISAKSNQAAINIETNNNDMDEDPELMMSDIMGDSEMSSIQEMSLDESGDLSLSPVPKKSAAQSASHDMMNNTSKDADSMDEDGNSMDDSFERQVCQLDHMQNKFVKLSNLEQQYGHMISKLNHEIHMLQDENNRLNLPEQQTAVGNKVAATEQQPVSEKVKQDLRQKSKDLEAKIKDLAKKEVQMQKIMQTKEKLAKELDQKQEQIQTYKRDKVKLMKKIQETNVAHRVETKILVKNDIQARQRAVRAEANAAKLSRDLSSRERFWQSKLDVKKMEMERLKTLLQKREDVKKMRGMSNSSRNNSANASDETSKKMMLGHSIWKSQEWKKKLQDIISLEHKMAKCNGAMQFQLQKKRGLQQDRIVVKQKMRKLRASSPVYKELEDECKLLDAGILAASQCMAQWQMKLTELEATFNATSSSTALTTSNNNAIVATAHATASSTTTNISMKDFLQALMAYASSSSSSVNNSSEGKEEWKYCVQTLWEQLRQTLQSLYQVRSEVQDLQMHGMDMDVDEDAEESDGSHLKAKKKAIVLDEDEDEDVGDDGSALDDTFYPSEDESMNAGSDFDGEESSDDDNRRHRRRPQKNATTKKRMTKKPIQKKSNKRKRNSEDSNRSSSSDFASNDEDQDEDGSQDASDDDDDSSDSSDQQKQRPRRRAIGIARKSGHPIVASSRFSFVDDKNTSEEYQQDHALTHFIRNQILTVEDIMQQPTYFTLALSLLDMIPEDFTIGKYDIVPSNHTNDGDIVVDATNNYAMVLTPGMEYKRTFTAADAWKQHFPLRTIKQREDAWVKLKNTLALFFTACIAAQNGDHTEEGGENIAVLKPEGMDVNALQHASIAMYLSKLKLKETAGTAGAAGGVVKKSVSIAATTSATSSTEEEKWNKYTIKDLKPFLSERNLPVSGTKKELVARLVAYEMRAETKPISDSDHSMMDDGSHDQEKNGDEDDEEEFNNEEIQQIIKDVVDRMEYVDEEDDVSNQKKRRKTDSVDNTATIPSQENLPPSNHANPLVARDRSNYLKSLSELTSSAAAYATVSAAGVSKRSFRLNLDELTEELDNRPSVNLK